MNVAGVHYIDKGTHEGGTLKIFRDGTLRSEMDNAGNVTIHTGDLVVKGKFGCNEASPQPSYTVGAALVEEESAVVTIEGVPKAADLDIRALVNQLRAALVACGLCS